VSYQSIGLPPCSSFCQLVSKLSHTLGTSETYGDWAAHAQSLPHEQLRACPHEHLLRGAHQHHARRLHSQDPCSLEHRECNPAGSGRVESVSSTSGWGEWIVSSQEAHQRYSLRAPEKAESLIGCDAKSEVRPSPTSLRLRHDRPQATHCRHTTTEHDP
jgi:hypothetical protein